LRPRRIGSLPCLLLAAGIVAKTTVLTLFHITEHWRFAWVALDWDPLAVLLSEKTVGLFFDQRRIAPGVLESAMVEVFLVVFFGMECFLVGWLVTLLTGPAGRSR
jgi:hypothetical protein